MKHKRTITFVMFCSSYVLFICIGASIYLAVEENEELKRRKHLKDLKNDFLRKYPCVDHGEFQKLVRVFQNATRKGMLMSDRASWNFGASVLFVISIVTTVGYGNIVPLTESGKLFTIIFSLFGIPLTLIIYSALVERLLRLSNMFFDYLYFKLEDSLKYFTIRLLHLGIVFVFTFTVFLIVPALCYSFIEPDWNFLDSLYFCVVSLFTTGFGDMIPGEALKFSEQHKSYLFSYKLCTATYIFIGITFMTFTLAVFHDIPELNLEYLYAPGRDMFSRSSILPRESHKDISRPSQVATLV